MWRYILFFYLKVFVPKIKQPLFRSGFAFLILINDDNVVIKIDVLPQIFTSVWK